MGLSQQQLTLICIYEVRLTRTQRSSGLKIVIIQPSARGGALRHILAIHEHSLPHVNLGLGHSTKTHLGKLVTASISMMRVRALSVIAVYTNTVVIYATVPSMASIVVNRFPVREEIIRGPHVVLALLRGLTERMTKASDPHSYLSHTRKTVSLFDMSWSLVWALTSRDLSS